MSICLHCTHLSVPPLPQRKPGLINLEYMLKQLLPREKNKLAPCTNPSYYKCSRSFSDPPRSLFICLYCTHLSLPPLPQRKPWVDAKNNFSQEKQLTVLPLAPTLASLLVGLGYIYFCSIFYQMVSWKRSYAPIMILHGNLIHRSYSGNAQPQNILPINTCAHILFFKITRSLIPCTCNLSSCQCQVLTSHDRCTISGQIVKMASPLNLDYMRSSQSVSQRLRQVCFQGSTMLLFLSIPPWTMPCPNPPWSIFV